MSGFLQIIYLVWLAATGLIYLTLMLAVFTRYSLPTGRSRIPRMLLVGRRCGITALGSIAFSLVPVLLEVAGRSSIGTIDLLHTLTGELTYWVITAGFAAIVTMIPIMITWMWRQRLCPGEGAIVAP